MRAVGIAVLLMAVGVPLQTRATDLGAGAMTGNLPAHDASDASAPLVTEATLLENERFWPYQVGIAGSDAPLGVLIRVEPTGVARIDFGRDGLREVPIAETDLVERANRVRSGDLEKMAPNFLLALGPRLVDSTSEPMAPLPYPKAAEHTGFLCVFADPASKGFAALAAALAPLQRQRGVGTILFPQAESPDPKMREQLRKLKWPVPFVYDHLSEPYTRSLVAAGTKLPFVMLKTREGRVLYESSWNAGVVPALRAAIDANFDTETMTTAVAPERP